MRTEGHNTLTVDNQNQELKAEAPLTAFFTSPNRSFAVANLQAAYPRNLSHWERGLALLDGRQVLVQDEVQPRTATGITWNFHTRANLALAGAGREATLSQGAAKLLARILAPADARFETLEVHLALPERPTTGVRNLVIRLPQAAASTTIAVLFSSPADQTPAPTLRPLNQWQP